MDETMPARHWPDNGVVEFKKYSTRYRQGLNLVLRGISAKVKGGEKVRNVVLLMGGVLNVLH